ncbi:MAG: alpha/beta hydrolase [Pseudomonadota bacterium]
MNDMSTATQGCKSQILHHHDMGHRAGRPVIFLHGANQSGAMWGDVAALLPDHRAVCFDLPGTGLNRTLPFEGLEAAADAVAGAMRCLFPNQPLPVAGVSLGAYVGLLLALRHPRVVSSVTLSGFQTEPLKGGRWAVALGMLLSPLTTRYGFRKRAARMMGIPEDSALWPRPEAPCSPGTLNRMGRAAVAFEAGDQLQRLEVPLLALAGTGEPKSIRDSVQRIRERSDNAQAAFVPGGHAWVAARPDLFAHILLSWIEDAAIPADPEVRPFPALGQAGGFAPKG